MKIGDTIIKPDIVAIIEEDKIHLFENPKENLCFDRVKKSLDEASKKYQIKKLKSFTHYIRCDEDGDTITIID